MDANRPTPRHVIIKITKVKDKREIFKSSKKTEVSYWKVTRWEGGRGRIGEYVRGLRSTNR